MSVIIYAENWDGKFKKISFEIVSFGAALAKQMGTDAMVVSLGKVDESELLKLANYGAGKILFSNDERFAAMDNQAIAKAIAAAVDKTNAEVVVLAHNNLGKAVAPRLAVKLHAGLVTGINGLPVSLNPFKVNKNVFTGKAIGHAIVHTPKKVLTLAYNSFGIFEHTVETKLENFDAGVSNADFDLEVEQTQKITGKILLSEAETVVAGGRGMKAAENWGQLEEFATLLGAATACSRPVSDEGWRPHAEHVGQTGKIIAPNLYFAFGISGAIQHLGGVSASKCIVAVNKDPDAPIFEAATYGIVGDIFKVLPQFIEAVKEIKS